MALRLHLFRHGETEWARTGQHTGNSDIPLTETGETEARGLCRLLAGISFDYAFTSPRQRAKRTCELAGFTGAEIDPDLSEWNYGDYEGLTSAQIHQLNPGWNVFRDGCPNGESPEEVTARADRLVAKLRGLDGNVALFSHGQFLPSLAMRWAEMPVVNAQHFPLATASLSVLSYALHHPEIPVVAVWNAVSREMLV